MSQVEGKALISTLDDAAPTRPTACAGWTARDIVAHLAAGSQEIADLIEEKLAGRSARPTRTFEDREPPYRRLPDDELWRAWMRQIQRKREAVEGLADLGDTSTFDFTGASMTAAQSVMHSRSEAAIHRWDVAGSDAISDELLSQPVLTEHAVGVLNAMPILDESAQRRARHTGGPSLSIVLCAEGRPDIVLSGERRDGPRWEIVSEGNGVGDAVVHTDPAHRLLVLWGRRSMKRPLTIEADDATVPTVCSVLWPASVAWC
jgi:uncharacterized protein (TIGR03083 family)